jgi:hypothetical protein
MDQTIVHGYTVMVGVTQQYASISTDGRHEHRVLGPKYK